MSDFGQVVVLFVGGFLIFWHGTIVSYKFSPNSEKYKQRTRAVRAEDA